jgi:tungstate transport system substrate-binding protein
MTRFILSVLAVVGIAVTFTGGAAPAAEDTLTLATTTSTDNSGLLARIHPDFEKKTGIRVKVVAKGTGASLQLARDGNTDVILVHAREHEDQFVAEGYGVMRRDVMYNDFIILGPKNDPAGVRAVKAPAEAITRIAGGHHQFVSRGDGSGTHVREQQLWRWTRLPLETKKVTIFVKGQKKSFESARPLGDWYLSVGQGMGKTIMIATERRAYTLADRGTYYAFSLTEPAKTDLVILCEGHESLHNPYGVIAVNPERHPHVNFAGAKRYIEWITSGDVQQMIGQYTFQGKVLFHPNATAAKDLARNNFRTTLSPAWERAGRGGGKRGSYLSPDPQQP